MLSARFLLDCDVVIDVVGFVLTFCSASAGFPEVQDHKEDEHQHQQDTQRRAGNDELPVALRALE